MVWGGGDFGKRCPQHHPLPSSQAHRPSPADHQCMRDWKVCGLQERRFCGGALFGAVVLLLVGFLSTTLKRALIQSGAEAPQSKGASTIVGRVA